MIPQYNKIIVYKVLSYVNRVQKSYKIFWPLSKMILKIKQSKTILKLFDKIRDYHAAPSSLLTDRRTCRPTQYVVSKT
jgi:hypothetical protein